MPALMGIQGRGISYPPQRSDNAGYTGLLIARAYAVTDHKRLVLAVLGILGACTLAPDVVCAHVFMSMNGVCDGYMS